MSPPAVNSENPDQGESGDAPATTTPVLGVRRWGPCRPHAESHVDPQTWKSGESTTIVLSSTCCTTAVLNDCVFTKWLTFQTWFFGLLGKCARTVRKQRGEGW